MSTSALKGMLLSTFYELFKEYGLPISYTKPLKGDIDSDTGVRDSSKDKTFNIDAVETPVEHSQFMMMKTLGRWDKPITAFMIRVSDVPKGVTVATGDYFTASGLKYKIKDFTVMGETLIELFGETFT